MNLSVAEAIASHACSTSLVHGLSLSIVREMLLMEPGCLVPVVSPRIHGDSHVHLYLQPVPAVSLMHVLSERPSVTLILNSCFRVLPEQLMLWRQCQEGRCGVTLAARPGESPHEIGAALDLAAPLSWKAAFLRHGWVYLGPRDKPHFQHMGDVRRDLGALGVRAFQTLSSRHGHGLEIDGEFGPSTEAALLVAPANGWTE